MAIVSTPPEAFVEIRRQRYDAIRWSAESSSGGTLSTAEKLNRRRFARSVVRRMTKIYRAFHPGVVLPPANENSAVARSVPSAPAVSSRAAPPERQAMPERTDQRFLVVFPEEAALHAALATEAVALDPVATSPRRGLMSVGLKKGLTPEQMLERLGPLSHLYGAQVVPELQFVLDDRMEDWDWELGTEGPGDHDLDDVLRRIGILDRRGDRRGQGVEIAIVDTGIDGRRPEFPVARRAAHWEGHRGPAWQDDKGHGTMCACIAAAGGPGARFQGVAPDAGLISCRTTLHLVEVIDIYDMLIDRARNQDARIVVSNSWGFQDGSLSREMMMQVRKFTATLEDAAAEGIVSVFSAGNNHRRHGGQPHACAPSTIWHYKCRDDVLTVGTCDMNDAMWYYSSRGPGNLAQESNHGPKPDVVAPTPANGVVLSKDGPKVFPIGWGTSGAAPQAAGLAALLLQRDPGLSPGELFDIIRSTARPLGHGPACEGAGCITGTGL